MDGGQPHHDSEREHIGDLVLARPAPILSTPPNRISAEGTPQPLSTGDNDCILKIRNLDTFNAMSIIVDKNIVGLDVY